MKVIDQQGSTEDRGKQRNIAPPPHDALQLLVAHEIGKGGQRRGAPG